MPLIYQPKVVEKKKDYMIIPQYTREIEMRCFYPDDMIISMNTNNYKSVIDSIVSCKKVYSSSLHGIILAEAFSYEAPALPDLSNLQKGLMDAFPYDLWEE